LGAPNRQARMQNQARSSAGRRRAPVPNPARRPAAPSDDQIAHPEIAVHQVGGWTTAAGAARASGTPTEGRGRVAHDVQFGAPLCQRILRPGRVRPSRRGGRGQRGGALCRPPAAVVQAADPRTMVSPGISSQIRYGLPGVQPNPTPAGSRHRGAPVGASRCTAASVPSRRACRRAARCAGSAHTVARRRPTWCGWRRR
jgi:hypothetical protein